MQTELPRSYESAIADGWRVVHERTPLVHGEGRLLLCKDGVPESIEIGYRATTSGYEYAGPQVTTEDVAAHAEQTWASHYREFGCAACETTETPHAGYGLCQACIARVSSRLEQTKQSLAA
jgi:hypothetical protein